MYIYYILYIIYIYYNIYIIFCPKFGCYGNSLGSLEILDSIFEFANPENLTIHAKNCSISCT